MGKSRKPSSKNKGPKKDLPPDMRGPETAPRDSRLDQPPATEIAGSTAHSEEKTAPGIIDREPDAGGVVTLNTEGGSEEDSRLENAPSAGHVSIDSTGESSDTHVTEEKEASIDSTESKIGNPDITQTLAKDDRRDSDATPVSDSEKLSHADTALVTDQDSKRDSELRQDLQNHDKCGKRDENSGSSENSQELTHETGSPKCKPDHQVLQQPELAQNDNPLNTGNTVEDLNVDESTGSTLSNVAEETDVYAVSAETTKNEDIASVAPKEKKTDSSREIGSSQDSSDSVPPSSNSLPSEEAAEPDQNNANTLSMGTNPNPTPESADINQETTSKEIISGSPGTSSNNDEPKADTNPTDSSEKGKCKTDKISENEVEREGKGIESTPQSNTNETVDPDGPTPKNQASKKGNDLEHAKQDDAEDAEEDVKTTKFAVPDHQSDEKSTENPTVHDAPKDATNPAVSRDSSSDNHNSETDESKHQNKSNPASKCTGSGSLPLGMSLTQLDLELPLTSGEQITCTASHDSNLYIGTSHGQILHLYLFEDADQYILIMMLSVNENTKSAVSKLLVIPDAEVLLVLAANTVYSYSLPELAPCRGGKIKDVEDFSLLSVGRQKSEKNRADKVVVYTASKLRVVHVTKNGIKLLRDINYTGAKIGVSSASGTSAHYSNICIIANDQRYDVVDMQQARKIPLFDYNPAESIKVTPYIIPYQAQDSGSNDTSSDGESSASVNSAKSESTSKRVQRVLEEYLLSICTEESTSIAMFINSAGDATRGTVTWIGHGYPVYGISIEWPFIVGLFQVGQDTSTQKMVFSSLESLDVIAEIKCHELFKGFSPAHPVRIANAGTEVKVVDRQLSDYLCLVACGTRNEASPQKQFGSCRTVFSDGTKVYVLQKQSKMSEQIRSILDTLSSASTSKQSVSDLLEPEVSFFSENVTDDGTGRFSHSMHMVLLLLCGQYSKIRSILSTNRSPKLDPRLLILFCVESSDVAGEFWDAFHVQRVFLEMRDLVPQTTLQKNREFYIWLLKYVYAQGDMYDDVIGASIRKLVYTETYKGQESVLKLIDTPQETKSWQGQNLVNDELIAFFKEKGMNLVLLHIYTLKQNCGNPFEPWPLKIIDICLYLLSEHDKCPGLGAHNFDLPLLAFNQLLHHVTDEDLYTKKLLKLLQLSPERGISLLKSAKGSQHASTHKFILEELSKSYTFDSKFSLLKIEYTEQSFLETSKSRNEVDLEGARELFRDYLDYLNQPDLEVEYENLNILFYSYKIENTLSDPQWPKITWIEYLNLHHKKGDCEEFLKVYLKVYELVVLFSILGQPHPGDIPPKNDPMAFLAWITNVDIDRESLLYDIHDYTTAEWLAFYAHPHIPRTTFFLDTLRGLKLFQLTELPGEIQRENLNKILKYYLSLEDTNARNNSAMHAVGAYAGRHLSIEAVLSILPDSFPLVFVEDYVMREILSLEQRKSDSQLKKALHKANAKLQRSVLKDYEETRRNLDEWERNGVSPEHVE